MTDALKAKLHELRGLPAEAEWFDFKEAKGGFDPEKLLKIGVATTGQR